MTQLISHLKQSTYLIILNISVFLCAFSIHCAAETPISVYQDNNSVETVNPPVSTTPSNNSPAITINQVPSSTQLYGFTSLSRAQQNTLEPLRPFWEDMSYVQKKKWLSVADQYAALSPLSQARIREKMQEWAKLTPQQRKLARENFTNVQSSGKSDKHNQWQEYQKLSPESKLILIERAQQEKKELQQNEKPVGTAATTRPKNKVVTPTPNFESQTKPTVTE